MRKAALHNLGCKVNAYETEAVEQLLKEAGYEIVQFNEKADVYVINTCSVTNMADRKSRQMIHRAKKLNPESVVVAAGCYVQTATNAASLDDTVDIIIGNNRKQELVSIIDEYVEKNPQKYSLVKVWDINHTKQEYEELKLDKPSEHTRAFLKVQDGCNQFCSYCIIPYARGRIRSRDLDDVIEETKTLAANGYKEVVLTGIHLSSYGKDKEGLDLLDMIRAVNAIDGIERIRLGSLEPRIITDEFVMAISQMKKVCPHFHLSLQSGSETVLKRMNRHYTPEECLDGCSILRKYYEHPAITTDIIVGFPGETDEEFKESCDFARKVGFYEIHVFKYSRRDGTVAAKMTDQIPESIKTSRSTELINIGEELKSDFENWYYGKTTEVLFEEKVEYKGKESYCGYNPEYVKIFMESDKNLENTIVSSVISGREFTEKNIFFM